MVPGEEGGKLATNIYSSRADLTYNKIVINSSAWKFYFVSSPGGGNPVANWRKKQEEETRVFFDSVLNLCIKTQSFNDWPRFKYMQGKPKKHGIWEIGWYSERRQYRLFGIFDGAKQAVIVGACFHKAKKYDPWNALDEACQRANLYTQGKSGRHERTI